MTIFPSDPKELAAKCREFRISSGISYREIAEIYGSSISYIYKAETGQRRINEALVIAYIKAGMPAEVKLL